MKTNVVPLHVPSEMQTVNKGRKANTTYRSREYLTEAEVEKILAALRRNRYGQRDWLLALLCYRHGFRVSELIDLQWSDFNEETASIIVRRLKGSISSGQELQRDELNGLRKLRRDGPTNDRFVFVTERGGIFTRDAVLKMVRRAGEVAGLAFPVHPHMFRHGFGYKLANGGEDAFTIQHKLGHANINHSTRYVALAPRASKVRWKHFT